MKSKFNLVAFALFIFISCQENDNITSCIEAPAGVVVESENNLTVFFEEGLELFSKITIKDSDGEEFSLDTSNFSKKPASDWQVVPKVQYNEVVLETTGGTIYNFTLLNAVNDTRLVLKIDRSVDKNLTAEIKKYIPCNDLPNG